MNGEVSAPLFDLDDLAPLKVSERIGSLRDALAQSDSAEGAAPEGLVITKLEHLRYLFGFTGSSGLGWVGPDEALLVTDARYRQSALAEVEAAGVDARVEVTRNPKEALAEAATGLAAVGLEAAHVSWDAMTRYSGWFANSELVPTTGLVEQLRAVKDAGELARIEAAASVADAALAEVQPLLLGERSEAEIAHALDSAMVRRGATGPAYETIVASGPNGAKPHARPGSRRIERGDLVVIDVGAVVDGYRSDMTRTFSIGPPDELSQRMIDVVTDAQAAGVEAVADGVAASEVDKACRNRIDDAGWAEAFEHGTGHGVGLDIHEAPAVNARTSDVLASGQVVTVEPGVYLAGHGGVRVEDLVVVTDSGCQVLSGSPKDPVLGL